MDFVINQLNEKLTIKPSAASIEQLKKYVIMIEEKNKVMNLTGFSGKKLWIEGIYESLICLKDFVTLNKNSKLLDIGAGAGFPSVPWAILYPNIKLTIYEPIAKRTKFLLEVKEKLNLNNITIINERIETSNEIEKYDCITARAVANLDVLIEISHKVAKLNANFLFIKGPSYIEELKESSWIIKKLKINNLEVVKINDEIIERKNFVIKYSKTKTTPKNFPRSWQKIITNKKKN